MLNNNYVDLSSRGGVAYYEKTLSTPPKWRSFWKELHAIWSIKLTKHEFYVTEINIWLALHLSNNGFEFES